MILVPIVADVVGTVAGQDKKYWKSNYKEFEEAVPIAHLFLKTHPLVFIVGTLVFWLPTTYLMVTRLPEPLNLWAAMALFSGHSYNSVHWLRTTQKNLGIFKGKSRVSITLSLLPMTLYILIISYIAMRSLVNYL